MKELNDVMLSIVSGGMNLDGMRESQNVQDLRGNDKGNYIDANGVCWAPGTPSIVMFPDGIDHYVGVIPPWLAADFGMPTQKELDMCGIAKYADEHTYCV